VTAEVPEMPGDPERAAEGWLARLARDGRTLPQWWHVLKLAEEAGEAVRAWSRATGYARGLGTDEELAAELADVVITAYAVACLRGLDLPAAVAEKHWLLLTRDLGGLADG
jgi:NTP pyrophosphatase (non-canonical NTP hydrolase)